MGKLMFNPATPDAVINNLTSDSTTDALSAAQGKALNSNKTNFSVITGDEITNVDIGEIYNNHIGGIARKESSDSGTATTVGEEINKLIKSVASLAIVIPESRAPQAIPAGKFVIIKNDSNVVPGIYQLKQAMAENDWVSVYNLRSFSDGILSLLNDNLGSPSSASSVTGADAFTKINSLNGKFTTIETITLVEGTKSLASGSFATLATRNFGPGSYLIVCTVSFQDATAGVRIVLIDTTETNNNYVGNSVLASGRACLQYFRPITLTNATTLYFRAYQNSGGDITASWRYHFIKL